MTNVTNDHAHRVRAIDGTLVDSPAPAVQEDGYLEIQLGDRSDHRLNVSLTRGDDEAFWRINLPDHDGEANSSIEMQNCICRLVMRAASLCLLLNGSGLGGDSGVRSAGASRGEMPPTPFEPSTETGGSAATLDDLFNVADCLGVSPIELMALRTASAKNPAEEGSL